MTELRMLRRELDFTQVQLAEALSIPANTLRMWDSGLRRTPSSVVEAARALSTERQRQRELLSVRSLAVELGIHKSTLEAAIRAGRLTAQFSTRSVFGRPIRAVARGDGERFKRMVYGHRNVPVVGVPLSHVPADYAEQLTRLRRNLDFSQAALARQIGAAGKAVIYQWESRKRVPSPVFWERIQRIVAESPASKTHMDQ